MARNLEHDINMAMVDREKHETTLVTILPHDGVVTPLEFKVDDRDIDGWKQELESQSIPYTTSTMVNELKNEKKE